MQNKKMLLRSVWSGKRYKPRKMKYDFFVLF